MRIGHCRHDWKPCNETLRETFTAHAGLERVFRICVSCLRIEELEPRPLTVSFRGVGGCSPSLESRTDERAA